MQIDLSIVDITEIARQTESFSGADLRSLLSTAQIIAARETVSSLYQSVNSSKRNNDTVDNLSSFVLLHDPNDDFKNGVLTERSKDIPGRKYTEIYDIASTDDNCVPKIDKYHILNALKQTSASISAEERTKSEELHRLFSSDKRNFRNIKPGNKETLA